MQPENPKNLAITTAGTWEWAALAEYGLACLRARLDPTRDASLIRASHVRELVLDGRPAVRFRVHPLADDPLCFLLVEARRWPQDEADGVPRIRTTVSLGEQAFPVVLQIIETTLERTVEATAAGFPVILGRDVLDGRFNVLPGSAALLGPPSLGWRPRPRRRRARTGAFGSALPKKTEDDSRFRGKA